MTHAEIITEMEATLAHGIQHGPLSGEAADLLRKAIDLQKIAQARAASQEVHLCPRCRGPVLLNLGGDQICPECDVTWAGQYFNAFWEGYKTAEHEHPPATLEHTEEEDDRSLNPTSAELFAAMREKQISKLILHVYPIQGLRFLLSTDRTLKEYEVLGFNTWPEVLTHLGLYNPDSGTALPACLPVAPAPEGPSPEGGS